MGKSRVFWSKLESSLADKPVLGYIRNVPKIIIKIWYFKK